MLTLQSNRQFLRLPLTPLIDVVFILLLFFMLSSTFVQQRQLSMEAATPAAGGSSTNTEPPVSLLVGSGQRWQTGKRSYGPGDAERAALLQNWKDQQSRIRVTAIDGATVQDLVSTLDALAGAGITQFSLTESRP
ncbi:biopolymer transporter ExbD [Granulosicoccaceae sp. 1_MG-2023]|nr:biopolymer transporter ExbD [Granulosicoccaceae sp. 1_MG-2023]